MEKELSVYEYCAEGQANNLGLKLVKTEDDKLELSTTKSVYRVFDDIGDLQIELNKFAELRRNYLETMDIKDRGIHSLSQEQNQIIANTIALFRIIQKSDKILIS
tara:strand:+ start:605 stop:919 length:315 start_codon:yes stop_codon:yes gene_type:complete